MTWADTVTAVGTVGLLIATSGLAVVAWIQIRASTKSVREAFARQARQHYFDVSLAHPDLAARDVDLSIYSDRERYFSFLSLLFSAMEDSKAFVVDDEFSQKAVGEDLTAHLMFIVNSGVKDWKFHFSRSILIDLMGRVDAQIRQGNQTIDRLEASVGNTRKRAESFGLELWIERIDTETAKCQGELEKFVARWETFTPQFLEFDVGVSRAVTATTEFNDLPEGHKEIVRNLLREAKLLQAANTTNNLLVRVKDQGNQVLSAGGSGGF